ncbi:M48 family metalloprotease [Synechococcus sp. H60.4]|uniref:M48 family metalloprotease n=1 Tax=unclassified Synechococcus TaxID=2626047 RepID=UPI0039C1CB07
MTPAEAGKEALRQGRFQEAIQLLEAYLAQSRQQGGAAAIPTGSSDSQTLEAQMNLVRAYHLAGEAEKARALCLELLQHPDPQARGWAQKILPRLPQTVEKPAASPPSPEPASEAQPLSSRQRAAQLGLRIPLPERAGSLRWAKWGSLGVGILFLWGLSFVLVGSHLDFGRLSFPRQLWFLQGLLPWLRNGLRWLVAGSLAVNFGVGLLFFAPWLMDHLHRRLHKLRWATLGEIERHSPEAARLLQRLCTQKQLKQPRLGVIPEGGPLAFVYGTFPDGGRIVVTQALLQQLAPDEIAAVYAQALGRIVNGDILILTLLGSPLQLVYLALEQVSQLGNKRRDLIGHVAPLLYLIYTVLSYPLFFLSRLGTSHADHFAVEATGNPNGLVAALLKSAAGLQEAHKNDRRPSSLLHCARLFSFLDFKTTAAASAAVRLRDPAQAGQVFLWDQLNPWARWMQVNSSHPLPGHRFQVLAEYAQRLRLLPELRLGSGSKLDGVRLQSRFWLDLAIYAAEVVGILVGWLVGLILYLLLQDRLDPKVIAAVAVVGCGLGLGSKAVLMYRGSLSPQTTDVLHLLADPEADPCRSQPVELEGELLGLGQAGYQLGAELKLQDATGLIPLRFTSPLGPVGNVFSGLKQLRALMGRRVKVVGWFRRGNTAWVDLAYVQAGSKQLHSRPRLWLALLGLGVVLLGIWGVFYFPNLRFYLRRW